MITVMKAPPYLTVQDFGRFGQRAVGVPPGGVMDRKSASIVNVLLGNAPNTALLEWAVAGGVLRFDAPLTIAVGGAIVECSLQTGEMSRPLAPRTATRVAPGDALHVTRFVSGRFFYIAVAGGIDVPLVGGSRSTNVTAGFGGFAGRRLAHGDVLAVTRTTPKDDFVSQPGGDRTPMSDRILAIWTETLASSPIRVVRGPQASLFDETAWRTFLSATYRVSHLSDRMGYRLEGPSVVSPRAEQMGTVPSEPTCVGAIQIPPGGGPIVLMQDGPTVGGYSKIAVIRTADLDAFAQRAPGDAVRFVLA